MVFKTTEVVWQESCKHIFNVACHEIENRPQGSEQSRSSLWSFICIVNRMDLSHSEDDVAQVQECLWRFSNNDQVKDPPILNEESTIPRADGPAECQHTPLSKAYKISTLWFITPSPPGRWDFFKPQSSSWLLWVSWAWWLEKWPVSTQIKWEGNAVTQWRKDGCLDWGADIRKTRYSLR